MDLSGFLFGNVDEEGVLEDGNVLDKDEVAQLSRLGVVESVEDVAGSQEEKEDEEKHIETGEEDVGDLESKLPTAEDFTDIAELAEEERMQISQEQEMLVKESQEKEKERLYQKGVTFLQAASTGVLQVSSDANDDYDEDYDEPSAGATASEQTLSQGRDLDANAAPEPHHAPVNIACPLDLDATIQAGETPMEVDESIPQVSSGPMLLGSQEQQDVPLLDSSGSNSMLAPLLTSLPVASTSSLMTAVPSSEALSLSNNVQFQADAGQLPAEMEQVAPQGDAGSYTNPMLSSLNLNISKEELYIRVQKFFPSFKPNGILCFSSLFPSNPASLPRPWQDAKRRRRKRSSSERVCPDDWKLKFGPVPPPEEMDDQEARFLSVSSSPTTSAQKEPQILIDEETSEWRFGPAQFWYDLYNVPQDGRGFDYGFKLKTPASTSEDEGKPPSEVGSDVPDDVFLMVTQQPWENKVLWDVPYTPGPPVTALGGAWTTIDNQVRQPQPPSSGGGLATSMFPVESHDLISSRWEDNIIWDSEAVSHIPRPCLARLDPNDSKMIVGIPDEPVVTMEVTKENKKESKRSGKSWMSKASHAESQQPMGFVKKNPFNLSNDEYYNPKHATTSQGLPGFDSSNVVQHSTPTLDLFPPWFPTYWSAHALRNFHRPRLKIKLTSIAESSGWLPINNLLRNIIKKDKERERERVASGGGEVFFMRQPEDVSASDGQLVLAEYSEEHPPLVMATGMATKVKNYYRRPERQTKGGPPSFRHGETTYIQNTSYFLGTLKPGQSVQSFENNLFRAPIYHHNLPATDFLVIRSDNKYYVREVEDLFVVGQECPKVEVPAPNSKTATQFQKELLQFYLYRLFQESEDKPKKLKMEAVRRAFPVSVMSESGIRKVLKQFADFKREGYDIGYWALRPDIRLPTEEELRALITPEQACAYYSMLAAEQRLKDAGYGGKTLFAVEEEEEDESSQKIDDEVRAAPWNTTRHFVNAMKGKYQLSVSGPADPSGCGEGFSYTRANPKESSQPGISPSKRPKSVMGTDADLRKLKLSKARAVLRNFGVPEEEIQKLSRWRVIDMVRTISTEAAKSGGVDVNSLMFARGTRFSHVEAQERYREECQRVFDLQNKVLGSSEILSTDEESSDSGGESEDELGRNLESLLASKKTAMELSHEQEEAERQELRRLLLEDHPSGSKGTDNSSSTSGRATPSLDVDDNSSDFSFSSLTGRRLVISRTFRDEGGREYVRHEVVKNQAVIDAYVRIMSGSREKDMRMQFAEKDEQTREDMRKEVKKLQHAIRQLDKMEERAKQKPQKTKKEKFTAMHLTCSACGQKGHMKTNKNCPKYKNNPVQVAPTDAELAEQETLLPTQDDLVQVEGTKVFLKKDLLEHANDVRRKSLVLRFPKDKVRKRRKQGQEHLDYLEKRAKAGQRRRTNPEVPFAAILEKIIYKLSNLSEAWAFCKPVSAKAVPDYYNFIKFPMDLQTMKDNVRKHRYETREQFLEHVNLIVSNCVTYNGFNSDLTKNSQKMLDACQEEVKRYSKQLEQLEKEINPLLGNDSQLAVSYLLRKSVEKMKSVPDSWPFHFPVSAKKLPDYHRKITSPMDLDTMRKRCDADYYGNREEFLVDLNQVVENSVTYNGSNSNFTRIAEKMRQAGLDFLEEKSEQLSRLESDILVTGRRSRSPGGYSLPEGSVMSGEESLLEGGGASGSGSVLDDDMESTILESGQIPLGGEEIDVEGLGEIEDDDELAALEESRSKEGRQMDIHSVLLEDLQHSSSSDLDSDDSDIL